MKQILTIVAILTIAVSSALAGCGKKAASIGKLEKFDAATKTIIISIVDSSNPSEIKSKKAKLTMTPDTKIIAGGKVGAEITSLVGKKISVVSEHGKIDFIIGLAGKS